MNSPRSFDASPFIAIWETTRACALACVHCRAEAMPRRHPDELTTGEAKRLIDRVRAFGDPPPLLVFTGGDPLRRPDIVELVSYASSRGLIASLTPSGTAAVTEDKLLAVRDAGLARLAASLDGATADTHDNFRGVRGSHAYTMRIVERARRLGLPLQINTTVCHRTAGDLPALAEQMRDFGVVLWALFFLIPVGRAQPDQALSATEIEEILEWAADLAARAPFGVKTTEAPQYHRVLASRAAKWRAPTSVLRAGRAVTDGNGFVFIDHLGEICPSGFLPVSAGNVRRDDLVTVYREAPLFRALRDPSRLGGRCGRCEYREGCGGSRARAHAATGDPLTEDPGCAYAPLGGGAGAEIAVIAGASDALLAAGAGQVAVASAPELAATPRAVVTASQVIDALRSVVDPELGISIVDLGLVYGIAVDGGVVHVTMTLTAPGCPIHEVMPQWVQEAVGRIPGVERVDVTLTFDPPWTPDRIAR